MTQLSPRQREILSLVAAGRTSKEIAGQLGISESTVNWHISNVFGRLGASSRAEAVALAMRDGQDPGDEPRDQINLPQRRTVRPPLPLSAVTLAVAVTLVIGLLGGAVLAGWEFTSLTSPSPSSAPIAPASHPQQTVAPAGVRSPAPTTDAAPSADPRPSSSPVPGPTAAPSALPLLPALGTVGPMLPALSPTGVPVPVGSALPTLSPLPSIRLP